MPYLVYIKKETGYWHLTKKKNLSNMVGVKGKQSIQHNDRFYEKALSEHNNDKSASITLSVRDNDRLVVEKGGKKKDSGRDIVKQTTERKSELKNT